MYQLPKPIVEALGSVTEREVTVEWTNDLKTWQKVGNTDAPEITSDRTSQVRWYGNVELYDAPRVISSDVTRIRIALMIRGVRMPWTTIPMGEYRVDTVDRSGRFCNLKLSSYEAIIKDHTFHMPRSFPVRPSDSKKTVLEQLIRESVPNAKVLWDSRIKNPGGMNKVTIESDRWSLIDGDGDAKSIAKAIGADVYTDRMGNFLVQLVPTIADSPVWSLTDRHTPVEQLRRNSRDKVKNVWTVWADPGNGKKVVGPVHAWDNNPKSPTYAGTNPILYGARDASTFGIVPGRYQNPLVTNVAALTNVARARLANSIGVAEQVLFDSIFNPMLEAGDVVELIPEGESRPRRFLLDKVNFKMDQATMQCDTRSSGAIEQEET